MQNFATDATSSIRHRIDIYICIHSGKSAYLKKVMVEQMIRIFKHTDKQEKTHKHVLMLLINYYMYIINNRQAHTQTRQTWINAIFIF